MENSPEPLENLWDALLSREPERIRQAFAGVDKPAQSAILAHLERMVKEEGWHPLQQASAQAALDILKD